jgi:transposase-like protein
MDVPLVDLSDPRACYDRFMDRLHTGGLACTRCGSADRLGVHRRHREPVLDYRCGHCGRVFNTFTETPLRGFRRPLTQLRLIHCGIGDATPTAQLARELGCDRKHLPELRHPLQGIALFRLDRNPLGDATVEYD